MNVETIDGKYLTLASWWFLVGHAMLIKQSTLTCNVVVKDISYLIVYIPYQNPPRLSVERNTRTPLQQLDDARTSSLSMPQMCYIYTG